MSNFKIDLKLRDLKLQWFKLFDRLISSTSKLDAEKKAIQVQLA